MQTTKNYRHSTIYHAEPWITCIRTVLGVSYTYNRKESDLDTVALKK